MKKEVVVTAASINKAIEEALEELGAELEDVEVEILEEPTKKLFGGTTSAKVRVYIVSSEDRKTEEDSENHSTSNTENERVVEQEDTEEYPEEEYEDDAIEDANDDERSYNRVHDQLSEEELDTIADTAIETIRTILKYFGAENSDIDEYEGEEGELILDIMGDNLAVLIGRHGKTIDAIQFLVSSVVNKKTGYRHPLVIDVKGYKHRRKQKIVGVAKASAARAIRQKHEVRLRPMTPFERRIVHVALRDDKRVTTVSEGTEPNRYIVIKLK